MPRVTAPRQFRGYKFLVTGILAIEYGLQVVMPAVLHDTQPLSTIVGICAVGVASAFVVEFLLSPTRKASKPGIRVTQRAAMAVLLVGWVATVAGSLLGGVGYLNQITSASASKSAAIFTPFQVWTLFGVALLFALARDGLVTNRRAVTLAGISLLLELALALRNAILGQAVSLAMVVVFLAVVTGVVRLRWILLIVVAGLLAAQPLYNLRNQERSALAQASVGQDQSAVHRLRADLEMAQVGDFVQIPINFGYPGIGTLIRFGLVPRVFDRGRGSLNTGERLSIAIGGSPTNSTTATTLGEAYIEHKWPGVIFFGASAALVVGVLARRRGPWALVFLAIVVDSGLLIESTFPDLIASILQAVVSMALAIVFCTISVWRDRGAPIKPTPLSERRSRIVTHS